MKAILIVNMPDDYQECCGNCQLLEQFYDDEHEEWYEWCCYKKCKIEDTESKLKDCPLRPLPDMENPTRLKDGTYFKAYDTGWNDCLKEITGE